MLYVRVEGTDRIPVHARPPQCMARQVGVSLVAEDLAVNLEIGAGASLLPPEGVFAERAVLGVEIFLPYQGRLDDMAVAVEHYEVLSRHSFLPLLRRSARRGHCGASSDAVWTRADRDETGSLSRRDGPVKLPDRRLGPQRGADFLLRRPPVRALDLRDTLADDVGRRLHVVEAPGVGAQEFGL